MNVRAAAVLSLLLLPFPARAALLADAAGSVGDSITRAFDADIDLCSYSDQQSRSFSTGIDHGDQFCSTGDDGTFSHAERLECAKAGLVASFNDAESGAKMDDFAEQASSIREKFSMRTGPYYVSILFGHNDACTNVLDKTGNDCDGDRDPNNYCRTTPAAYEREFRRGMDELIEIAGARIAVLAVIRISQLCNFEEKNGCGPLFAVECKDFWSSGGVLEDVFGTGGVCTSLTSDCSDQRRVDMYDTLVAYNEVLSRVAAEYAALAPGAASATGAIKADDVAVRYVDTTFRYRFQDDDLSCCDCFHPSDVGQRKLARFTWDGIECSAENPCCAASDTPLTNARCASLDVTSVLPGGFWPNGVVCGNGVVDPGESCDDGNQDDGDDCPAACGVVGGPTPTPTATADPSGTATTRTPTVTGTVDPSGTPDVTGTPDPSGTPDTTLTPAPSGTPDATRTPPAGCPSDCNGDGEVAVNEVILAVNIALGQQPVTACPAADYNDDGSVTVDELVGGVNMLLQGCG